MKHILALDIGGTNPRMAIVAKRESEGESEYFVVEKLAIDVQQPSLSAQINQFLKGIYDARNIEISNCCISVAGNIVGNACHNPPNAHFAVDGTQIQRETACKKTIVINDFVAIAHGILISDSPTIVPITQNARQAHGNKAVIGPGTGLGIAYIPLINNVHHVIASEAGHSPMGLYSPYAKMLSHMQVKQNMAQLSAEFFLSGLGIQRIAEYLVDHSNDAQAIEKYLDVAKYDLQRTSILQDAIEKNQSNIAEIISENSHTDLLCHMTLRIFFELFGSVSQSVALHGLPKGGLFLAGGILPKNIDLFLEGDFLRGFYAQQTPAMRELLLQIPIFVVLDYDISLIGCAKYFDIN